MQMVPLQRDDHSYLLDPTYQPDGIENEAMVSSKGCLLPKGCYLV